MYQRDAFANLARICFPTHAYNEEFIDEKGVELWVLTSFSTKELVRRMGLLDIINQAGGHIIANTCSDMMCWERLYKGKVGITDSPKAYYYNLLRGINFVLKRRSECIEAALKGGC